MNPSAPRPVDYPTVTPLSRGDIRFHVIGGVLNGICVTVGVGWLVARWPELAPSWPFLLLAVFLGTYFADLISGILHWAFDTWFDEHNGVLRRMVIMVREHHLHPNRIFQFPWYNDAGVLSWFALFLTGPWIWAAVLSGDSPFLFGAALCAVVTSILVVFMLEFHKAGHRKSSNPRWVRWLQRARIVLPYSHHVKHHSGNHDTNYCLIHGLADLTLGKMGLWRGFEKLIELLTGAIPQRSDHEWLLRYARSPRRIPPQAYATFGLDEGERPGPEEPLEPVARGSRP